MTVSLRPILFRLHWALGLTAGLVLALMGVTGALMSYEEAIQDVLDADLAHVRVEERARLGPEALIARAQAQRPGLTVDALTMPGDAARAPRARFARVDGRRPASAYLDPHDGTVRGQARAEEAFATIRSLHRWLLLPGDGGGWGRTVTGFCALALIAFLATGLYLRWPGIHRWRIWLRPSLARPGRARWWSLHAVLGTWLVPVYLVLVLTGLWWSYGWYRTGATWLLTGTAPAAKTAKAPAPEGPYALDAAWAAFSAGAGRDMTVATLTLPGPDLAVIRIRWVRAGAGQSPEDRDEMTFAPATGLPLGIKRAADKPLGRRIADNMVEVHRGRFFGAPLAFLFFLAALGLPVFAATGVTLYVLRRRAGRRRGTAAGGAPDRPAPARQFLARLGSSAGFR
ncbi:peptidase [Methylobacterium sp. Leaf456]|uniref:PepSY-associated TM helix domain-containing protein n=1 Tax=Methylobacterium sp. Leaf456 TaxID=1736382 RepID=UPI0006F3D569|nr:PepSY-associated TM helix domain-containing protein [Methylobacterium sp. Leaf456]KQT47875.1 peptidase [Methylobacterium sp. Leaf456]